MMNLTDKILNISSLTNKKTSLCYLIPFIKVQEQQTQFCDDNKGQNDDNHIITGVLTWKGKKENIRNAENSL